MTILGQKQQFTYLLSKRPPVEYKLEALPRDPACFQFTNSYSMPVVSTSTGAVNELDQSHRIQSDSGI
jgi:hypothetical protein